MAERAALPGQRLPAAGPAAPLPVAAPGPHLPCTDDPELFFAESPEDVQAAKAVCWECTVRAACLAGALQRREPWGVWGGELFLGGAVAPLKRSRGRPRKAAQPGAIVAGPVIAAPGVGATSVAAGADLIAGRLVSHDLTCTFSTGGPVAAATVATPATLVPTARRRLTQRQISPSEK